MEYFRRNILPDLVRYYRGVFSRRQIDPTLAFGDLVFAQQNFSSNVSTYIGILGSLWSSVVSVADFLQTDDLFQLGERRELPELPDFSHPPHWECGHGYLAESYLNGGAMPSVAAPSGRPGGLAASRANDDPRTVLTAAYRQKRSPAKQPGVGAAENPNQRATGPPPPAAAGAPAPSLPTQEGNHAGQDL
jgi:outer membrane protein, heavy metal efflux system